MYSEEHKRKQLNAFLGILVVVGIVFGLLFLIEVVSFLQRYYGLFWAQFVLYGFVILLVYIIIKKYMTVYIYLIEKDRLTFGRRIGKREKELLSLPLRDVERFGPYADMQKYLEDKKVFKYTFLKKEASFAIVFGGCGVLLGASEGFITKLAERKGRKNKPDGNEHGK